MPAPEPAAGRGRARLALLAPFIPLLVLFAAMGATEAFARDPDRPPAADQRFRAAPDHVNEAMGLVRSEACTGLLTARAFVNERSRADGRAAGCTHGVDLYVADAAAVSLTAEDELPPVPTPPGIPCYGSGPYVKVFYIYDKNGSSKLSTRKPLIREIVAHADKVIDDSARQSDARRHVRWLMASGCKLRVTAVGANLGYDVTTLRFNLMDRGLLSPNQKGLAFTEGSGFGSCSGIAEVWPDDRAGSNNMNNDGGLLALVYAGCWTQGEGVLMGTEVATHELVHTLGGVQPSAPNATQYFHCTDEADVMCYEDGSGEALRDVCTPTIPERLDCRRNDYFNPKPRDGSYLDKHWNTATNRFLAKVSPGGWDRLHRPSVSIQATGSTVSGVAVFTANATAPSGASIDEVAWEVNGKYVGSDSSSPYRLSLNTFPENGGYSNGQSITVVAHAVDNYFRWKSSSPRRVTVDNPRIRLLEPTSYESATGDMPWSAKASAPDGRTVSQVELLVNGTVRGTDTTAPFGGTWDARPYSGEYAVNVKVRVTDSGGTTRSSAQRVVYIGVPTVELLNPNPAAGTQTVADDAVLLAAVPHPVLGSGVDRVEFRVNGNLVGTDSSAPYTHLYDTSGVAGGEELSVRARFVDDRGQAATSDEGVVLVEHTDHAVTLQAPVARATVSGEVTLEASPAPGGDASVSSVTFVVDGMEVAYAYEAPWQATWTTDDGWTQNGPHVVSARAEINDGSTWYVTQSPGTVVNVNNPQAAVAISTPAAGSTLRGKVTLTASVPSSAGGVWDVSFYAGQLYLGSDFDGVAPYSATWDTRAAHDGSVPVRAVVSTDVGVLESPVVSVTVANTRVALTKPANGATVSGKITLAASARTDLETRVEWVRFYVDGKQVARDRSSPYSVAWRSASVPDGTHKIKAVLVTTDGRKVTSTQRTITVNN